MGPRQMLSQNLRDTVFHDGWQAPQEVEAGKEGGSLLPGGRQNTPGSGELKAGLRLRWVRVVARRKDRRGRGGEKSSSQPAQVPAGAGRALPGCTGAPVRPRWERPHP